MTVTYRERRPEYNSENFDDISTTLTLHVVPAKATKLEVRSARGPEIVRHVVENEQPGNVVALELEILVCGSPWSLLFFFFPT
jgi:hypothetical protein